MNLTRFKHFKSEFKIRKIFEQFNILNNSNIEKSKSEAQYHLLAGLLQLLDSDVLAVAELLYCSYDSRVARM